MDWKRFRSRVRHTLALLTTKASRCIVVNASMFQNGDGVLPFNIGDDLNYYLIKELTGKRVFNFKDIWNVRRDPVYLCIGSLINARWMRIHHNIVWGSGARNDTEPPKKRPKKVLAVRGPKTRALLLQCGIDCPEVYGDPVLLLPRIYQPVRHQPHYSLGIIPHMYDLDDLVVRNLQARYPEQVRIIDVKHYSDWHEVVDQILDCELILSSSLHGLIMADAYGVPNVWMKCSDKTFDGAFKYQDYLLSVGRTVQQPFQMSAEQSLEELMALGATYEGAHIDLEPLLKACPF